MNPIRHYYSCGTARPRAGILLVRHAQTCARSLRLCGRIPGIHLNRRGRDETRVLCNSLSRVPIAAVYSSPLERAVETATPVAAAHALDVVIDPALNEVDFGEWTGLRFDVLEGRTDWRDYNSRRACARIPGGESPTETQQRVLTAIDALGWRHRGELVVAVTHAELIRYACLAAEARSLDEWSSVDVATGSVVALETPTMMAR